MAVNISVQYNGRFLPDIILLTRGYYVPSENPFKYHVAVLFLQPMQQYIITIQCLMINALIYCF